jgi:hypothetical protein
MATATNKPGRFVPTLTQVVETTTPSAAELPELSKEMQEELVTRVMQRLDLELEQTLPEAISRLVSQHLQELGPRLWEEVGSVVQKAAVQAVAQELKARNGKA